MELITKYRPQFVVTTFPLHSAPFLIKKFSYSLPIYTVITDYAAHTSWINPLIDHYFVATDSVQEDLIRHDINFAKITVSGIPVNTKFYELIDKASVMQKYNLSPDRKTVTILAGAQGVLKNVKELCELFLDKSTQQLIVVCGKNESLYEKLRPLARRYPSSMRLLKYVDEIQEIFAITNCLVTKPGGITITEASSMQLPLILYKPVPGQEAENAKYFNKKRAAVISYSIIDTFEHAQRIIHDDELSKSMKKQLSNLHISHSAKIINEHAIAQSTRQSIHFR
jgi:processive 1,2-diacylglycerol beta-glucosyltransferase